MLKKFFTMGGIVMFLVGMFFGPKIMEWFKKQKDSASTPTK